MKSRKAFAYLLIVPSVLMILLTGCNDRGIVDGNIPFDSTKVQDHIISMTEAIDYTKRFRTNREKLDSILTSATNRQIDKKAEIKTDLAAIANPLILKNAEYFNRDAIAALLNQAGPNGGIRIYLGQDSNGVVRLVLIPATSKNDFTDRKLSRKQAAQRSNLALSADGEAIEKGQECPEMCPENSVLNQNN